MSVTDDVKAKLNIVDVVMPYAALQQSGRAFKSTCPFHTEKTPSFIVNPEKQSWRCFGACADGGDIFSFIMRAENMQFGDALRLLARRAGVELPSSSERGQANIIHRVNRAAAHYYRDMLESPSGSEARRYLDSRSVGQDARERFLLGLSPDGGEGLRRYLETHDFTLDDAVAADLIRTDDNGRTWDFFRSRLMFPIFDRDGNIAGFGARSMDGSNPKYINTARTDVFDKRNTLYALNFARDAIRSQGSAIIVEGYMDAIAAHEHGYANVVASMGTALTEDQVSQLRSMAQNFILALDPDMAGQEATLRSLQTSWRVFRSAVSRRGRSSGSVLDTWKPPTLKIASLPEGLDPDALIRSDKARWDAVIADAQPLLDFVIPALVRRTDLSSPGSRADVARALAPLINELDAMDQYEYWNKLAVHLGVPFESLSAAISVTGRRGGRRDGGRQRMSADTGSDIEVSPGALVTQRGVSMLEEYALLLLLRRPSLLPTVADAPPDCFRSTENRELFMRLLSCSKIEELRDGIDAELAAYLDRLEAQPLPGPSATSSRHAEAELTRCLQRLELRYLYEKQELYLEGSAEDLPERGLEGPVIEVNQRIRELQRMGAVRN